MTAIRERRINCPATQSFPCQPSRMGRFLPPPTPASPSTENRPPSHRPLRESRTRAVTRRTAISPGSLISIFGSGLAAMTASAPSIPFPMSVADTSVTIGGVPAPVLFESPGQINVQVPWEVPVGLAAVVVRTRGASSAPASITVQSAAPGLFTDSGRLRSSTECRWLREFHGKSRGLRQLHFSFLHWTGPGHNRCG